MERHHALDLVRGLAALAVAQYHFLVWNAGIDVQSMGTFAVYLFFTLSGLTMMMVYGDRFALGITPDALSDFFRKRVARLLPLLALVAVLAAAKQVIAGGANIANALLTGTGLMALHLPGLLSNSVGAWSLGIELAFYAVFPVIAVLARSWKTVAIWFVVLLIGQHLLLWRISAVEQHWHYYVSNLTFAPFFAMGILAAFDHGERTEGMFSIVLALLVAVFAFSVLFSIDLMRDQVSFLGLTILVGLVIWAAWRTRLPGWLTGFATFLGDISYSLYLTHWIANDIAKLAGVALPFQWGIYTMVALGGAYASYRVFEDPLRKRFGKSRHVSALTPNARLGN